MWLTPEGWGVANSKWWQRDGVWLTLKGGRGMGCG